MIFVPASNVTGLLAGVRLYCVVCTGLTVPAWADPPSATPIATVIGAHKRALADAPANQRRRAKRTLELKRINPPASGSAACATLAPRPDDSESYARAKQPVNVYRIDAALGHGAFAAPRGPR